MPPPRVIALGIGCAGSNAVGQMIGAGVQGVTFVAINTDAQALARAQVPTRIHIGETLTRGLGAGGDPNVGERAAEESGEQIADLVRDADLVFLVAGLGGGTGTGAAPVIARIAREAGALTVAVVTRPFSFEGRQRTRNAEEGVRTLHEQVHTLITIPCDRLLEAIDRKTRLDQAFLEADDVLRQAIQGISDLLTQPGLLNLGLADIKAVLSQSGAALMAIGRGTGETRAADAAHRAIASPLLNNGLEGARSVLLNITGGTDLALGEISEAADLVAQATAPEATISFGAVIDPRLAHEARVTLFVTGGRPHGQLHGGSGRRGGGPPPPDVAPLGARLPQRPRVPSDHAAALPPPSLDPQDEPAWFRLIPRIDPRAPGPPGAGQGPCTDDGDLDYSRAS